MPMPGLAALLPASPQRLLLLRAHQGRDLLPALLAQLLQLLLLLLRGQRVVVAHRLHLRMRALFDLFALLIYRLGDANLLPARFAFSALRAVAFGYCEP